ncbi:MAG: M24 family metallopeptidase [Proteobacteria bacterium]|nr:M24 family metallopeptidase [Pseudomonadota bacterium]
MTDRYKTALKASRKHLWHTDVLNVFAEHLQTTTRNIYQFLENQGIDHLVIGSGKQDYYHRDDVCVPFRTHPLFSYVCPMPGPYHLIHFSLPYTSPHLMYYAPDDFWHLTPKPQGHPLWEMFQGYICTDITSRFSQLEKQASIETSTSKVASKKRLVFLGPETDVPDHYEHNPEDVENYFSWLRSQKSTYEITCLMRATQSALYGHEALQRAFLQETSLSHRTPTERDLYYLYQIESQSIASEFAYPPIIAIDEHCATLHYDHYSHDPSHMATHKGVNLLVDAGSTCFGYSSDISRTTLKPYASSLQTISGKYIAKNAHNTFAEMLTQLKTLQHEIIQLIKPDLPFSHLHEYSLKGVYRILKDAELIKTPHSLSEADTITCARTFYPHGIGHMLGLQVHDVYAEDPYQDTKPASTSSIDPSKTSEQTVKKLRPKLRPYSVFTIEPGIYFIESLIDKLKTTHKHIALNDALITEMTPLGGMRVEDNIFINKDKAVNLTTLAQNKPKKLSQP